MVLQMVTKANYKYKNVYVQKEDYYLYLNTETSLLIEQLMTTFKTEWGGYLIGNINDKGYIEVEDIVLPRQVVSSAECKFCTEDEVQVIEEYKERYLGIIHSHNNLGAHHSPADVDTVNNSLMLSGDRFVSIVVSQSFRKMNVIIPNNLLSEELISGLHQIEFDGVFVKKETDKRIKHNVTRIVLFDYKEPSEELINDVTKRISKFIEDIEEYKKTYVEEVRSKSLDEEDILSIMNTDFPLLTKVIIGMDKGKLGGLDIITKLASQFETRDDLLCFLEEIDAFDKTFRTGFIDDYATYDNINVIGRTADKDIYHHTR